MPNDDKPNAILPNAISPDDEKPDPAFDAMTARLIRREALRRAALELSTNTPAGLESTLARISAEVTADAAETRQNQDDAAATVPTKPPQATST